MILSLVFVAVSICTTIFLYFKYKYYYWRNQGIPYSKPKFPFGNIFPIIKGVHQGILMQQIYSDMKGKSQFCGLYFFAQPMVLATDLDFAKNVLIKDFNYFHDRGFYYNERDDPLSAHLFSIDGEKWKHLRSKLTPTFTSGKMKFMFPTIVEVGKEFQKALLNTLEKGNEIEMKDLNARFTTDVIGSCAFGIECNSLREPNGKFREMGKKAFDEKILIKPLFLITFRRFARFMGMKAIRTDVSEFFMNIVTNTVNYREKNNVKRNDFMNLLLQLKKSGSLEIEGKHNTMGALTMNELAAQVFLFFLAGFETSSTTMSFCLYELALNQDVQDKARNTINEVLQKHGGDFTYEAMIEMKYLDQVINETLRKYPPVANLFRQATKDYPVPNSNKIIEKGTNVWIPAYAFQNDPEIYENPNIFNPDRFTPEAIKNRHPISFLSFGDGPRNCIGLRFGMMQARIGLVTLLKNFKFEIGRSMKIPIEFDPRSIIMTPKTGVYLKVKKI